MSKLVGVYKLGSSEKSLVVARWCDTFFCRLRGLMFRQELPAGIGLVLDEKRDGVTNTTIHMFAVLFPIGVLWVNSEGVVVDKVVAHPWRIYTPGKPARYIVEGPPRIINGISVGEKVEFKDDA